MSDKKWTYPPGPNGGNGQSVTEHEDGSVTVKEADGTETHYDPKTGNATKTPPNPPQVTPPGTREVKPDGEVRVNYGGTRIRFIPGPPKRFKIVRSAPATPREEDFNLQNGTRGVVPAEGQPKVETPPTSTTPEEITPSTHPKPAETPAPAPAPSGGSKDDKKKPKKKVKARRGKARPKKKPARKAKKKARKR